MTKDGLPIVGVLPLITEAERLTGERPRARRRGHRRPMWPEAVAAFVLGLILGLGVS
jgi:hypothetical protein